MTKLEKMVKYIVLVVAIPVLFFFSYYSLRYTVRFGFDYKRIPHIFADSMIFNMLIMIVAFSFLCCIVTLLKKMKNQRLTQSILLAGIAFWVLGFSFWWIKISQTAPAADQRYMWVGAQEFMQGNWRYFQEGKYFQRHPNQLGFVLFLQWFMKIFNTTNFQHFQYFNGFSCVACVLFLWKIVCEMTKKPEERIVFLILEMFCIPLFLYAPFVYNDIISLAFSLASIWCVLRFLKSEKIGWGIGSIGMMTLAIMCRKNMLIFLIAEIIFLVITWIRKKHWKYLVVILGIIVCSLSVGTIVTEHFVQLSGIKTEGGVQSIGYIAMGMQEGSLAEGWYNGYNTKIYNETGYNGDAAAEIAKQSIKDSISNFVKNPDYAFSFYKNKVLKQWNEPTYGGFINNSYHDERGLPKVAERMYYGDLHELFIKICNTYQLIVFGGALLYVIIAIKQKELFEAYFLITVFIGGVLFHVIWEADSRYALPYFCVLVPYSAMGIGTLYREILIRIRRFIIKRG